jgi:cytochrome c peroxidase
MTRKPIRVLAALAMIVLAGFAVAALSKDRQPPAIADMNHGNVKFAKGELKRILNAVDATTAQTPNDELVAEGRKIFRDPSLFEKGESCQTCHAEGTASARLGTMVHDTKADTSVKPAPPTDFDGPRDPPSLIGIAKTPPYFWNGNVPTLQAAVARPVKGHMKKFQTGDCATPSAACDQEAGALAAKLIAYVKTLDPPVSAFDEGTMSDAALRGEKLFQGKGGCIECHGGPLFTDNLVHNTGVPQVTFASPYGTGSRESDDLGAKPPPIPAECTVPNPPAGCDVHMATAGLPCDPANQVVQGRCSAFVNTPQMRDLKNTAPYMHNGAFKTLKEVVQFYNTQSALAPLNLTPAEVDDLVAYLESL